MAKFTKLVLITDDSNQYCIAVTIKDERDKYIHRDGTLHNRTDRRDDGSKLSHNGGFKTPKEVSKAIKKALEANFI